MPNAIQTSEGYGYIQHEGMFAGAVPLQPSNTFVPVPVPQAAHNAADVTTAGRSNTAAVPFSFILGGLVILSLVILKNSNP